MRNVPCLKKQQSKQKREKQYHLHFKEGGKRHRDLCDLYGTRIPFLTVVLVHGDSKPKSIASAITEVAPWSLHQSFWT